MLWDCSDLAPWRRTLALGLLLGLVGAPGPAGASGREAWLRATFPVEGFAGYTSAFGLRFHPVDGGVRPHYGLDIAAPLGSPVRNWWSGVLVEVLAGGGCGNGLVIRSGDYEHTYCHLAGSADGSTYQSGAVQLQVGQRLGTGQTIAHVGMTGSTTGLGKAMAVALGRAGAKVALNFQNNTERAEKALAEFHAAGGEGKWW